MLVGHRANQEFICRYLPCYSFWRSYPGRSTATCRGPENATGPDSIQVNRSQLPLRLGGSVMASDDVKPQVLVTALLLPATSVRLQSDKGYHGWQVLIISYLEIKPHRSQGYEMNTVRPQS